MFLAVLVRRCQGNGRIRSARVEPEIVEHLTASPRREQLLSPVARMGMKLRDLLRERDAPFATFGLDDTCLIDAQILDATMAHPILINRPIVVAPAGVRHCRPAETVIDLLPPQRRAFTKEDGQPVVDASGQLIATGG